MKAMNKLIGRFVLAVGLLAVAEAGLSESATLKETKQFIADRLKSYFSTSDSFDYINRERNVTGDLCIFYTVSYRSDHSNLNLYKVNLSSIYLEDIRPHSKYQYRINIDSYADTEIYESAGPHIWGTTYDPDAADPWKGPWGNALGIGGTSFLLNDSVSVDTKRVIKALKYAAKLCGAKDVRPQLQFE